MSVIPTEPEVHIVGEIVGGSKFDSDNSFCVFSVKRNKEWQCVGGEEQGQTQVDYPEDGEFCVWNHPLDLHYYTKALQGWPQIVCEVWRLDDHCCKELLGYGFAYLPMSSGFHEIECSIWRPLGNRQEEVKKWFVGSSVRLRNKDVIHLPNQCLEDRGKIFTKNAGVVHLQIQVILRNMAPHQVKNDS